MEKVTWEASSLLWVCSSNQGQSCATILDSSNPNSVIDAFPVCSAHILCVTSVPGDSLFIEKLSYDFAKHRKFVVTFGIFRLMNEKFSKFYGRCPRN